MQINDVLGYINHFVEHQGFKVIIIANEEIILDKQSTDTNSKQTELVYKDIKEKLIGETFEVKADLEGALDYFISNIKSKAVNSFYTEQKQLISRLYHESSYDNLRHLKQALWGFERFYEVLSNKVKESNGLLIDLLKVYLVYSFEIKSGNILANKLKSEQIEEKYTNLPGFSARRMLEVETWEDIFDKGLLNDKEINRPLLASNYFHDENTPDWRKLWDYWEITDDEFEKCIENVEKFFEERKYEEIGEIKHIVAELLYFSEIEIYSEPTDKILRNAKEYVLWLSSNDKLPNIQVTDLSHWNKSYESLGFLNRDSGDFKKLCRFIDDQINEANLKKLPEIGKKLLELMEKDVKTFVSQFIPLDGNCIYYDRPMLASIDSENFVDTFISLSPSSQDMVRSIFQNRYNHNINCDNELDWLVEIDKFMAQRQKQLKGKLSGFRLGKYRISLGKAIELIKERNG